MITKATTYVAFTTAVATVPISSSTLPATRHLVGIGLFTAEHDGRGGWHFRRRAFAIPAGEPESLLLDWATSRLTADATLIGWDVDHRLVPALLDAAASAPPTIAQAFIGALHSLLKGGAVDMSLEHGGAGAPPLAAIATDMAIYAPTWDAAAVMSASSNGLVDQLRHDLADEAMAIWRVFVRTAGLVGIEAEAATDSWVARRRKLRVVGRAGGAA